jgi:6-phosphogluconolactonase (cycloisomerase 2 family)
MTMKVRVLMVGIVLLAEMWLVGCGHYTCGATFGASSCTPSGGGPNQGGGGGGSTAGTYLLIANAGSIEGEVLDPTAKTFSLIPGFSSGDVTVNTQVPGDWMVVADGKFMYTAYTSIGMIYGWTLNGNGTITALTSLSNGGQTLFVSDLLGTTGGSQFMIANPAGTLLFLADRSDQIVHVFQIGTGGGLTETTSITLPSGFAPFNLAVDGQGKFLYISNIVGLVTTEVAVYNIGTTTLSAPVSMNLQQMQGEASGTFMVGTRADSADSNIHLMSIDHSTGALTEVGVGMPTNDTPALVAVQPNAGGNLVYSFDFSGAVDGASLNVTTSSLTPVAGSPFSIQGLSGEFDPAGKYLFVVEGTNLDHANMFAFDVSASPSLTTSVASVGWAAGAWQPFDIK